MVVTSHGGIDSLKGGQAMDWFAAGIAVIAGVAVFVSIGSAAYCWKLMRSSAWRQSCESLMRWSVRERYALRLCHANLPDWHVTDLWLLHVLCTLLAGATAAFLVNGWIWIPVCGSLGWLVVSIWVGQRIKHQQRLLSEQLPAFLDLLSMCLFAGMNLQTGVQLVLVSQGDTALANLWRAWLWQVRSGASRVDAFKQMLARVQSPPLRRICVALIQAEQSGSGMAGSIQAHSQQLRQARLMQAEKQALKAPVKMLLPLVLCFFPSTFLVLGFSIYVSIGDLL